MNRTHISIKKNVLLTGATGFVGQYILRDLLLAGNDVTLIVRDRGRRSSMERIDNLLSFWERAGGNKFNRPRLIPWDIRHPFDAERSNEAWRGLVSGVDRIVHAAASVEFTHDAHSGEPFASNVEGTRNVIELAKHLGDIDFHHISTAYVCGNRAGKIREDVQVHSNFKNVYEESKYRAEQIVLAARESLRSTTIYRPSIIVGDSRTGFASSFQTVYGGLKLAAGMPQEFSRGAEELLEWLGLNGKEKKDLVPVDWVSAALVALMGKRHCLGKIYHLTHPRPTTIRHMAEAMVQAIAAEYETWQGSKNQLSSAAISTAMVGPFLDSFQNYFCDDPRFDRTALEAALPDLPVPELTLERMVRMFRYSICQRFQDVEISPLARHPFEFGMDCENSETDFSSTWDLKLVSEDPHDDRVYRFDSNGCIQLSPGHSKQDVAHEAIVSASIVRALATGQLSLHQAMHQAAVVIHAPVSMQDKMLSRVKEFLVELTQRQTESLEGSNAALCTAEDGSYP